MYRLFVLMLCLLVLSACSTEAERRRAKYLEADYLTRLELPPVLIAEGERIEKSQLKLPEPSDAAKASFKAGLAEYDDVNTGEKDSQALSQQVAPVFEGLRLQSDGDLYWLEVDRSTTDIWPVLIKFWENEGIKLSRSEPVLGFMETDWVVKYQVDENDNFFSRLAKTLDKDEIDRFRLRVSRGDEAGQTKIFVSHSGMRHIVEEEDSHYVARASEPELEVEILSRLLVFMGLTREDASALLTAYRPFAKRAVRSDSDDSTLTMTGSLEYVWRQALRATDRLGFDVAEKNDEEHEIKVIIQKLTKDKMGGERDEIAESSFIMQWFSGQNSDAAEDESRQFILKLKPKGRSVDIVVLNMQRQAADTVLADQVIKSLLLELH